MSKNFRFKKGWEGVPSKNQVYLSLALNLMMAAIILISRNFLPPIVPLYYGRPVGAGQLVPTLGLLAAPALALVITILNVLLTFFTNDMFMRKVLISGSFFISVLVTITILKIIFLVGFF